MLTAFLLNLCFSVIELIGGIFTNSISIISDALHDFGDSLSIGTALALERKSEKGADDKYTYGYVRYSLVGALVTSLVLIVGSAIVVFNSVHRIINVAPVDHSGMIVMAIIGIAVNGLAAFTTSHGHNLNEKALSLHMLEDVLGWLAILVGSIVIKLTEWYIIDPILSLGITVFIVINAVKNLKEVFVILLERMPKSLDADGIKRELGEIEGVIDVHHIHIWTLDGERVCATLHAYIDAEVGVEEYERIKSSIREALKSRGIEHSTVELEYNRCSSDECDSAKVSESEGHHHHHHHHHH